MAKRERFLDRIRETPPEPILVSDRVLKGRSRRDFLIFGAGAAAAAAGFWWVMPDDARQAWLPSSPRHALDTLNARLGLTGARREKFLGRALTFDDDVAEALYSPTRTVRTYRRGDLTPLRNNYNGATPKPDYIAGWTLTVSGLASGKTKVLAIGDLLGRFQSHEQITRLVCVEGWSAVAWWGGLRFADFLSAFPPAPDARWAAITSGVNFDGDGESDPYYASIDLATARHPQALLATHNDGQPLTVEHGAPLRLLVPMKLGLKNVKAVTAIEYTAEEPDDYWAERGYSKYDGL